MDTFTFSFDEEGFSKIFPFYILLNNDITVNALGKSIGKVYKPLQKGINFAEHFRIKRPYVENFTAESLSEILSQLVILECVADCDIVL